MNKVSLQNIPPRELHHEKLQRIIETLPVSMAVFDRDLRFVTASDRFFQHTSLQKDTIKPFDHWYTLIPDMPPKWKVIHHRCLQGESFKCEEDAFYRNDGSLEWWRWEIVPLYERNQEVGGVILYAENITSQKTTEINLRKMVRRLHHSNTDLSRFAHECAHDLRAPLRTLSNYLDLLHDNLHQTLPHQTPQIQEYYEVMKKNADHMREVIQKTLQQSSASAQKDGQKGNQDGLSKTWFPMADVMTQVTVILKEMIQTEGASLVWTSLPTVFADKVLISQVAQNLVINALQYRQTHQPILHISCQETKDTWTFAFQDNGQGIKKSHRFKIFQAYQRIPAEKASSSSTFSKKVSEENPLKNLGLGLYKCKKIITAHGGKLWVQSEENQGATFYFTLPKPKKGRGK